MIAVITISLLSQFPCFNGTIHPHVLDEEDHQDGQHAYQINQGERSVDSSSFSSALYHITMAKRLMIEKTWSDVENHDAANMVIKFY